MLEVVLSSSVLHKRTAEVDGEPDKPRWMCLGLGAEPSPSVDGVGAVAPKRLVTKPSQPGRGARPPSVGTIVDPLSSRAGFAGLSSPQLMANRRMKKRNDRCIKRATYNTLARVLGDDQGYAGQLHGAHCQKTVYDVASGRSNTVTRIFLEISTSGKSMSLVPLQEIVSLALHVSRMDCSS